MERRYSPHEGLVCYAGDGKVSISNIGMESEYPDDEVNNEHSGQVYQSLI